MNRSANSAATIAKALSQPNIRSDGKPDSTVMASPQARTADVRISGGPTRIVARSTPTAGSASTSSICRRFRKWMVALNPRPNDTVNAMTLANCNP